MLRSSLLLFALGMMLTSNALFAQGANAAEYVSETFQFQFTPPEGMKLVETGSAFVLKATFPTSADTDNNLTIKISPAYKVGSFQAFQDLIIAANEVGSAPRWSQEHTLLAKEALPPVGEGWPAWRVKLQWREQVYQSQFVLVETPEAYLWINYSATPDSFAADLPHFQAFLASLEVIK